MLKEEIMFYWGLAAGIFIGCFIGVFFAGLCVMARGKGQDNLIRSLKQIRDSQENDLAEYAIFCYNTAKEALREVGL